MVSMDSREEVPVFTDTNMGTHIAIAVSPHITSGDFKRELERVHFDCFQGLGEIRVYGLMVKQNSCFYHLPDSVPIKHAFQGLKGTWFLCAEASPLSNSNRPECVAAEVRDQISNGGNVTDSLEAKNYTKGTDKKQARRKGKKRRVKGSRYLRAVLQGLLVSIYLSKKKKKRKRVKNNYFIEYAENGIEKGCLGRNEAAPSVTTKDRFAFFASGNEVVPRKEWNSVQAVETPTEMSSEVISVTGIIKRYFSYFDDVSQLGSPSSSDVTSRVIQNPLEKQLNAKTDDNSSNIQVSAMPDFTAKTPPRMLPYLFPRNTNSEISRDKFQRTEVGKRLLVASNNLGISASKQRPAISMRRFKDGKLPGSNSSLVRSLVFDISDDDD